MNEATSVGRVLESAGRTGAIASGIKLSVVYSARQVGRLSSHGVNPASRNKNPTSSLPHIIELI